MSVHFYSIDVFSVYVGLCWPRDFFLNVIKAKSDKASNLSPLIDHNCCHKLYRIRNEETIHHLSSFILAHDDFTNIFTTLYTFYDVIRLTGV